MADTRRNERVPLPTSTDSHGFAKRLADLRLAYLPVLLALCVYVVVVVKTAWLSDDAYITLRTIQNFLAGDGLRFNVAERVQAYTHPLWLLLLAGVAAITRELDLTTLAVSAVVSISAVGLLAGRVAAGAWAALLAVAGLTLSKAFTDYSTSGLENPLLHLLLVLFVLALARHERVRDARGAAPAAVFPANARQDESRTLFSLSLLAALLFLTRPDAVLLVAPALLCAAWQTGVRRAWRAVLLGLLPALAWEAFSLIYYGFLLPNTAYAKLHTGLPPAALARRGMIYIASTFETDPLTLVLLAAGLLIPVLTRRRTHIALSAGGILYLAYIVAIGGDFMQGRFLTAPLLIAVLLLARVRWPGGAAAAALVIVLLLGLAPSRSPLTSDSRYGEAINPVGEYGIDDERAFYYPHTGLLPAARVLGTTQPWPTHKYAEFGRTAGRGGEPVVLGASIGMFGHFAGRHVHVVDEFALADPLLARLPPVIEKEWRSGHLRRELPAGYFETLLTGENRLRDPHLAAYYERLARVTRGPLFEGQRWRDIVALNFARPIAH